MAKKIIVQFELNLKDAKKLIKSGAKGKMLSDKEVDNLIKKGAIHASDFLDKKQLTSTGGPTAQSLPQYATWGDKATDRLVKSIEPKIEDRTYKKSYEKSFSPTQKKESGRVTKPRGKDVPQK